MSEHPAATPTRHLFLLGGGARPKLAMQRFVERSGSDRAHILVVAWASEQPEETFDALSADLNRFGPALVDAALEPPLTDGERRDFLAQLARATGVFFSGGDQNRIMDALEDPVLREAMHVRYAKGVVFGGTSAGTAVMSPLIISGDLDPGALHPDKVGTRRGLGLIPDVVIDQHFLKRQRQNRLFAVVIDHPEMALGIGIDEGTALEIENDCHGRVIGHGQVMMINPKHKPGSLIVDVLKNGQQFDLHSRERHERADQSALAEA